MLVEILERCTGSLIFQVKPGKVPVGKCTIEKCNKYSLGSR